MNEMLLCLIISTVVLYGTQLYLFITLSEFRYERKKCIKIIIALGAVSSVLSIVAAIPNDYVRSANLTLLTATLPSLIVFFILSKYRGLRFLTTYCVCDVSIGVVDMLVYMVGLILYRGNFTVDWIVRSVALILWTVALHFFIGDRYRKALNMVEKGWWIVFIVMIIMYVLISLISAYPTQIQDRPEDIPMSILVLVVLECVVIIIIRVVYNSLNLREQEMKQQVLEGQLEVAEDRYTMLKESMQNYRHIRHDMKYHMNVIRGLLDKKDYDELQKYIENYQKEIFTLDSKLVDYTKNQTVNVLTQYYVQKAAYARIETDIEILIPQQLPISDVHMTVLLGNMWQNALEACGMLEQNMERYIHVKMRIVDNKLVIKCENTAPKIVWNEDGTPDTTKGKEHGNGISSMQSIAEIYGGHCVFQEKDGIFTFAVVLEMGEDKEKNRRRKKDGNS